MKGSVYILDKVDSPMNGTTTIRPQRLAKTMLQVKTIQDLSGKSGSEVLSPSNKGTRLTMTPRKSPKNLKLMRMNSLTFTRSLEPRSKTLTQLPETIHDLHELDENLPLTEEMLFTLFPSHRILNTLFAPNYFGEVALNEATTRYV